MLKSTQWSILGTTSAVAAVGALLVVSPAWAEPPNWAGGDKISECGVIDAPGSYELANNLTGTYTGGNCLQVTANFVTIDLAGFTIDGGGCSGCRAINAGGNDREAITVMNGSITGYDAGGMDLSTVADAVVRDVRAVHNYYGIAVGEGSVVSGNTLNDNTWYGAYVVCPSLVIGNVAVGNGTENLHFDGAGCAGIDNLAP